MQLTREILDAGENSLKELKFDEEGRICRQKGVDEVQGSEWQWLQRLNKVNPKLLFTDTYFALVNTERKTMKKGSEALVNYGKKTNFSLLAHNDFCLKDNLWDSVKWHMKLDVVFSQGKELPALLNMVSLELRNQNFEEIRFKRCQFNHKLMAYIRICFRRPWTQRKLGGTGLYSAKCENNLLISKVSNLEFEMVCLERYRDIVVTIIKQLEEVDGATSMEEDLKILNDDDGLAVNQCFAILYRFERKKTMRAQLELV